MGKDSGTKQLDFKGKNTWYAFANHVELRSQGVALSPYAKTVKLPVPYLSQRDNYYEPPSTCNVTCVAMCLSFFGAQSKDPAEQLEDELYRRVKYFGLDKGAPYTLRKIVEDYGCRDDFKPDTQWVELKEWLNQGSPCIVHGWFTASGHIVVICGYNDKGFICHDPWGEYWPSGYDTTASGKYLTYSYSLMEQVCGPDRDLWIHKINGLKK